MGFSHREAFYVVALARYKGDGKDWKGGNEKRNLKPGGRMMEVKALSFHVESIKEPIGLPLCSLVYLLYNVLWFYNLIGPCVCEWMVR